MWLSGKALAYEGPAARTLELIRCREGEEGTQSEIESKTSKPTGKALHPVRVV